KEADDAHDGQVPGQNPGEQVPALGGDDLEAAVRPQLSPLPHGNGGVEGKSHLEGGQAQRQQVPGGQCEQDQRRQKGGGEKKQAAAQHPQLPLDGVDHDPLLSLQAPGFASRRQQESSAPPTRKPALASALPAGSSGQAGWTHTRRIRSPAVMSQKGMASADPT